MRSSHTPNHLAAPGASGDKSRASLSRAGEDTRPYVGTAAFHNPESAELNLERIAARLSAGLASGLRSLLADSPDPDGALLLFERLSESPEVVGLLERQNLLAHYAVVVFGHSRFLGETLLQNADLLPSLLSEQNLDRSFSREEFHENLVRFRTRSLGN